MLNNNADIYGPVFCVLGCNSAWSTWCRGCNNVFCITHADMETHKCKRTDLVRGNVGSSLAGTPKRTRKKRSEAAKETQLMLGDNPSGNGKTNG